MSEDRLKGLAALTGIGLVAVIVIGALVGSAAAADDLQPRAEQALAAAGLGGLEVDLTGREAVLSGGTPDELDRGERVVEGVDGIRSADIVLGEATPEVTVTPTSAPELTLSRTRKGLAISGTVPDADVSAGIKVRAAEDFGVAVVGDLVIDPSVGPASWLTQVPDVFGDVVGVKGLVLRVDGSGNVELDGVIESDAGADRIRQLVAAAVPDLEVVSRLDIRAGDLTEVDAAVLNSSTLYFGRRGSRLSAANQQALDVVADVLTRHAQVAIEVGGHTGPTDPARGEQLSTARVSAVKSYLVRAGVAAARIGTRTYGSGRQSTTDAAARQYRRVDFVVTGG